MKILLFLGSGISTPSGYPKVSDIYDAIQTTQWIDNRQIFINPSNCPEIRRSLLASENNYIPFLKKFISEIKTYLDAYYKRHYLYLNKNISSNYEDIYYFLDTLAQDDYRFIENPLAPAFEQELKRIIHLAETNVESTEIPSFLSDSSKIMLETQRLIKSSVFDCLKEDHKSKGLSLIENLANNSNISKLDIITLNHDMLIENHLEACSIKYFDCFSKENDYGSRYLIEDLSLLEAGLRDNRISLLKPHGSVDWFQCILQDDTQPLKKGANRVFPQEQHVFTAPEILCGSFNKLYEYQTGFFRLLHIETIRQIWSHNTIVMSGYGWNDRAMNGHLFDWLDKSSTNKLILLHEEELTNLGKSSKSSFETRYQTYIDKRQLIYINKWLCNTTMKDLKSHL